MGPSAVEVPVWFLGWERQEFLHCALIRRRSERCPGESIRPLGGAHQGLSKLPLPLRGQVDNTTLASRAVSSSTYLLAAPTARISVTPRLLSIAPDPRLPAAASGEELQMSSLFGL